MSRSRAKKPKARSKAPPARAAGAARKAAPGRDAASRPVQGAAVPLRHPALIASLAVAALCIVVSASYVLYDTDLWQHLVMGKAIWAHRGVPATNLWTWPQYGEPYFLSSWGFRALVWPLWNAGGIVALYLWRWITTLAVFGVLYAIARVMGARGFSAVLVLVWASLDYRLRTDVRPETIAALLLAVEYLLLERQRRAAEPAAERGTWWIVLMAWIWANVHISWYLGFLLLGIYGLDALAAMRHAGAERTRARARFARLLQVGVAAVAVSFLNPSGWVALSQPFQFAFSWRHDPLVRTIGELQPLPASLIFTNGLFVWPLLLVIRALRRGWDVAEVVACAIFTAIAISSIRFVATWAMIAAPFVARDLEELLVWRRWPLPRLPLAARGALTAVLAVVLCLSEWARPDLPLGIAFDPVTYPEKACDFMAAHGIRGRSFNHSHLGGYLPFRFWPDRERLPFISTQPEYTRPADRQGYVAALTSEAGWRALDQRYRFDYVLLEREQSEADSLLDFLDRDRRWALVFSDDAAELLIPRDGAHAAVADSFGYRLVPAGRVGRYLLGAACERDPALRRVAEAELDRMIASSPRNGSASHLRGWLALMDGDFEGARRHLERALALKPLVPGVSDQLGQIALRQNRPRDALRWFAHERRLHQPPPGFFYRTALAHQALGEMGKARDFYRRELARDPGFAPARDSLAALERPSAT